MPSTELVAPHRQLLVPRTKIDASFGKAATATTAAVAAICTNCRNLPSNIVHDFGQAAFICTDCNAVVEDCLIGSRSDWRKETTRQTHIVEDTDALILTSPFTLGSIYTRSDNTKNKRSDSASISGNSSDKEIGLTQALRSRTHTTRAMAQRLERHERNISKAFVEITAICVTMDLPQYVRETARELYRRVENDNLHRGKSNDAIVATCIFLACRQKGVPRTFKEICTLTRVPRKEIGRTFKYLKEKLGAETGTMSSDDLMARFCSNLSLLSTAQECAILLNQTTKERDTLAGKSPVSIAGACIYMASHLVGQPRDARVISHVAGVSEVTIKNAYKLLFADREHLLSPQVLAVDPMASVEHLPIP
ncbi:cyclin-like protein [Coemansia reversa NRRL 1564]|uniref:Transcription initiation factor IIB n=1 Tax=Coemansia reversa (strain ATCC 12441 / NRRL 1564) TaxID=763665 RepID=A0A2G5BDY3_COERN|nr:cyclin-like protein [Coemansia reversa NRRL 1564]|eukprot:PIA17229.1 cyclin-like protein [Coemansia reversa NRRL 1564]